MIIKKIYAGQQNLGKSISGEGLGPFGMTLPDEGQAGAVTGLTQLTNIISAIIGVMTIAAGIWFLFNFIIGGIQWLGAGGDKNALEQSRKRITNAFLGLIIVISGITILSLASVFLGFDFLITNPQNVIESLFPAANP